MLFLSLEFRSTGIGVKAFHGPDFAFSTLSEFLSANVSTMKTLQQLPTLAPRPKVSQEKMKPKQQQHQQASSQFQLTPLLLHHLLQLAAKRQTDGGKPKRSIQKELQLANAEHRTRLQNHRSRVQNQKLEHLLRETEFDKMTSQKQAKDSKDDVGAAESDELHRDFSSSTSSSSDFFDEAEEIAAVSEDGESGEEFA